MTALVLIHGFTGSPRSFERLRQKLDICCVPRPTYHWVTLPGHGPSPILSPAPEGFLGHVRQIAHDLQRECPDPPHLLGYSLGARVSLALLMLFPRLFSGATLVSAHPGLASARDRQARLDADARRAQRLLQDGVPAFVADWEAEPLFATQSQLCPSLRAAHRAIRLSHTAPGLAYALQELGLGAMPYWGDRLAEIQVDIDWVVGALDLKFLAMAAELEHTSPRLHVHRIPGAGHDVALEAPERLARILLESLRRKEPSHV